MFSSKLRRYILVLGSFAAGCAPYRAIPLDPAAELRALDMRSPVLLTDRADPPPSAARFDPEDGFGEAELIAIALRLNTEIQAARAALGESQATLLTAGLFPDPELGMSVEPGIDGTDGFSGEFSLQFELLRWGERDVQQAVARAGVEQTRASISFREYAIATEVRRQLTAVLAAEQELHLLDQELGLRRQGLELVQRQRAAGEANALGVAAAQLELFEVERERRQAAAKLPVERVQLNRLLGLPPQYPLRLTDSGRPLEVLLIEAPAAESLQQAVITGRLDLREKEAEYQRAESELRMEVVRQYPSLKIGPAYTHDGPSDNYLGIAVALDVPLLNRNLGQIAGKLATRDRVRAEYVDLLHSVTSQALGAAGRLSSLRAEVEAQRRDLLPLLEQNERLFRSALEARELSIVDFVTLQQQALKSRRTYLRTLADYRLALIDLDGATGLTLAGAGRQSTTTQPATQPNQGEP